MNEIIVALITGGVTLVGVRLWCKTITAVVRRLPPPYFSVAPNTMTPGDGSDGGKGADGVLLIYY